MPKGRPNKDRDCILWLREALLLLDRGLPMTRLEIFEAAEGSTKSWQVRTLGKLLASGWIVSTGRRTGTRYSKATSLVPYAESDHALSELLWPSVDAHADLVEDEEEAPETFDTEEHAPGLEAIAEALSVLTDEVVGQRKDILELRTALNSDQRNGNGTTTEETVRT